jgi:hypothetical protein
MEFSWIYDWIVWVSLIMGLAVAGLVYVVVGIVVRPFRMPQRAPVFNEEDIPWEGLHELMKGRYTDGKSPANEELPAEELMQMLMTQVSDTGIDAPSGVNWSAPQGERRRSLRRWFNPIEVVILSPFHENPLHGLVINRSTGGLAILSDISFDADTVLRVRPMDAPAGITYVEVTVRHARKASKLWVIGCQYKENVAWNVKVWFG